MQNMVKIGFKVPNIEFLELYILHFNSKLSVCVNYPHISPPYGMLSCTLINH